MEPENQVAPAQRPGRWLILTGWLLLVGGIAAYLVQFAALKQYVVPWYAAILGTLGLVGMLVAVWQRRTVLRIVGLVLCTLLVGFEWFFLLHASRLPDYAGPAAGQRLPAFTAIRGDGSSFTDQDLASQASVVVFFRGHWWLICLHELGELEGRFADFAGRGVRIIAVSVDDRAETAQTQAKFPQLILLGDPERKMTEAVRALHVGAGPGQTDVAAPTTLLLDQSGTVRWVFRPDRVMIRLTPEELLAAVDQHK